MAMALFSIKRVENTQVTGTTTRWTAMELYIILMDVLLMKDNGRMTCFMEKAYYTTKNLQIYKENMTFLPLNNAKINNAGFHTMAGSRMMKNPDMENFY